jgi:hypothetical protein
MELEWSLSNRFNQIIKQLKFRWFFFLSLGTTIFLESLVFRVFMVFTGSDKACSE